MMRFFLEFLDNFQASQLLWMYASGAFRTADEITMADFTINYKIVFNNEVITKEQLEVYRHLQGLMDTIRAKQGGHRYAIQSNAQVIFRCFSTDETHFNFFVKYGENERESPKFSMVERRMIFAFKKKMSDVSCVDWLKVCRKINFKNFIFYWAFFISISVNNPQFTFLHMFIPIFSVYSVSHILNLFSRKH